MYRQLRHFVGFGLSQGGTWFLVLGSGLDLELGLDWIGLGLDWIGLGLDLIWIGSGHSRR